MIHLVNPSNHTFGVGAVVPRWLYVLAAATPARFNDPVITDETLTQLDERTIRAGDVVGIGVHTGNALRGYELGRAARARGATVIFGGIHATLYPHEALELGGAHAVVKGDGDVVWSAVLEDWAAGRLQTVYEGGRVAADRFAPGRWDLLPPDAYLFATVQTVRGCPKHCSFCSVWRTDGQQPRQRAADAVIAEISQLRALGFRFIILADDNFYPVTKADLAMAARSTDRARLETLETIRAERFELMRRLADLPDRGMFFTQITMEAAEDPAFLDAMREARVMGALVGVETVTADGLKAIHKTFNNAGAELVARLQTFERHGVHVLASFIFGLPTDTPATFEDTVALAQRAGVTFAQFIPLTPFPGTTDFARWEKSLPISLGPSDAMPLSRFWLIPQPERPRVVINHPTMSPEEIHQRTEAAWKRFYALPATWARSGIARSLSTRLTIVLISKIFQHMFFNTGMATDSARIRKSGWVVRSLVQMCRRVFIVRPAG